MRGVKDFKCECPVDILFSIGYSSVWEEELLKPRSFLDSSNIVTLSSETGLISDGSY